VTHLIITVLDPGWQAPRPIARRLRRAPGPATALE
jgi:hypothetical protein